MRPISAKFDYALFAPICHALLETRPITVRVTTNISAGLWKIGKAKVVGRFAVSLNQQDFYG